MAISMTGRIDTGAEEDSSSIILGGRGGDSSSVSVATSPNSAGPDDGGAEVDVDVDVDVVNNKKPEVLLEGCLLKRNRNNYWQDRYFVFQSDQTLSYWHKHKQNKKGKGKDKSSSSSSSNNNNNNKSSTNGNNNNNNNNNTNANNNTNTIDATGSKAPTSTFQISRQAGCEIGDIYVEQRSTSSISASMTMASMASSSVKESLYCIDVSWTEDAETVASQPSRYHISNNNDSFRSAAAGEADDVSVLQPQLEEDHDNNNNNNNNWEVSSVTSSGSTRRQKTSFLRRRKFKRGKSASDVVVVTTGDKVFDYYSNNNAEQQNELTRSSLMRGQSVGGVVVSPRKGTMPNILSQSNLQIEENTGNNDSNTNTNTNTNNNDNSNHPFFIRKSKSEDNDIGGDGHVRRPSGGHVRRPSSSFEERETLEQEKLHNQFANKQRKKRSVKAKRVVDATKVAVAAGAAVGVGVVTAGVGLAAGLVFLGGAAALGGTAGVAEAGFKRTLKKKDNLTIATTDYAVARLWKSKLDACLEQEYIKQSTWAQRFVAGGGKTTSALIPNDVITMKTPSEDEHDNDNKKNSKNVNNKNNNNNNNNRSHHSTTTTTTNNNISDPSTSKNNLFLRDANILSQERTIWKPLEGGWGKGAQSLRIFKEEKMREDEKMSMKVSQSATDDDSTCTPLKTQLVLNAHPTEAFMCIMSYARLLPSPFYSNSNSNINTNTNTNNNKISDNDNDNDNAISLSPNSDQTASYRLLEKIDDHMDVLHLVCRPLYLFPSWTVARDFVMIRYWRYEPDGSYIICYESVEHADCPPQPGFVRGKMHQVYTIAPPKSNIYRRKGPHASECMLKAVVQVDPKGWIPTRPMVCLSANQTYADAFGVSALLQTLDVRDAIENDRFRDLSSDLPQYPQQLSYGVEKSGGLVTSGRAEAEQAAFDLRFVNRERDDSFTSEKFPYIGNIPTPLGSERWAEPDPNSFMVRGPNYKEDGVKINAGASIGQLFAVDCVLVDKPIITGMSLHPTERIQLALQREKEMKEKGLQCDTPPFIFVVNIIMPATSSFHAVFYYAVDDISTIDGSDGTPSSRLCQKFIFGDSDEFRDQTFKLIPRIVEGNFLVRKAVGSTPAIMGTRLKQYYVRTERFMEIVLDCGSSQVAEGVIKLSLGYAKTLVVDMGFLLEAVDADHLPEHIFGGARIKYPSFGNELRKVEDPSL